MRQVKWMLFQLLFISAFILPYICWTDEENKGVSGSDLPRCDQFQEIDEAYFDRLEFVGRHLLDSLQRIHDFERLQQKLNMRKSKQNKIKSAQYFDYRAYLKRQEKMLKEIDLLLLEKRQEVNRFADPTVFVTNKQRVQDESKKFADPAILEKGTGGNTNALQVIVSSTETKAGTALTNDVPRYAQTQEVNSDFFEKLEDVETQICDALLSIHSCDVVHQRKKYPKANLKRLH